MVELSEPGVIERRAWDAGIDGPGVRVRIDAETHVGDVQAVSRSAMAALRAGRSPGGGSLILL